MRESAISKSFPDLQVRELSLRFPESQSLIWQDISLEAIPGEITVISGPNASGKSCLIHSLCGVIPQSIKAQLSGEIRLGTLDLRAVPLCEIYRYMAVGLADAGMQMLFPSCELELAFALENRGLQPDEMRRRINASAQTFGITQLLGEAPQKLSGGEQRLLLFGICDSMQSPVLLLDEPETGLSEASLDMMIGWLNRLQHQGRIIIMATHNERLIALADNLIKLG